MMTTAAILPTTMPAMAPGLGTSGSEDRLELGVELLEPGGVEVRKVGEEEDKDEDDDGKADVDVGRTWCLLEYLAFGTM
jgi:hypothetical protein